MSLKDKILMNSYQTILKEEFQEIQIPEKVQDLKIRSKERSKKLI